VILSNNCIIASSVERIENYSKYSLAIIVWVNNFKTLKIQAVLSSFFHEVNDIACGSNRGSGWKVGSA